MENEGIFRLLLLLLIISFVANRAYYTRKFERAEKDVVTQREDQTWVSISTNLLSILALISTVVYLIFPQWMAWSSLLLPIWLRSVGVVFALIGFAILQWAQHALGKNWSDTPRLLIDQKLVTNGPYRWVRHPIYTAFLLIMSATLLLTANLFIGMCWLVATLIETISRVRYEENLMMDQFKARYSEYMETTGALFPRIF